MRSLQVLWTVMVPILGAAVVHGGAAPPLVKVGESLVDAQALTIKGSFGQAINGCSFQQEALLSHRGWQYLAYYDAERHVCLARRRLRDGAWEIIRFADYQFRSNDSHNTISVGICPADGTIHLAFDHHNQPLHYRVSRPGVASKPEDSPWRPDLFGPVSGELEPGKPIVITYPRFWATPDGGLQFCYRRGGSGNGDRMLVDYDPAAGAWSGTRQIDSRAGTFTGPGGPSRSRCSYPNGYTYGPQGRLHVTWVWRETPGSPNHDLMYAYSEDRGVSWRNDLGQLLTAPPALASPGITVVKISPLYGLMNTHGQAVDARGRVHTVVWHCSDDSLAAAGSKPGEHRWGPPPARRYHHYWRELDGTWHHTELPGVAGTRPKLFMDRQDNAYLICTDSWRSGLFQPRGRLRILAASAAEQWRDWRQVHTEGGPFVNEMLGDPQRWREETVLSVMVQQAPETPHQATALRVIDLSPAQ